MSSPSNVDKGIDKGPGKGAGKASFERFRAVVEHAIVSLNSPLKLYDLEYQTGTFLLRVYIINPETLTAEIGDCVKVDDALTLPLQEAWVPEGLTLEVSSPGIFRSLKNDWHFEMSLNRRIKLRLTKPLIAYKGKKEGKFFELTGKIKAVESELLKLDLESPQLELTEVSILKSDIQIAHWEPNLDQMESNIPK